LVKKSHGARLADQRRYDDIIETYLTDCYARRTAARVSELAALLESSRPYLSRVIPQLFGKPLRTLLRQRQLQEAFRLLTVTNLPIEDVAAASGFGTERTFYRVFREMVGMTPGGYREKVTK
jgi:AraC-like DNA-binding protein